MIESEHTGKQQPESLPLLVNDMVDVEQPLSAKGLLGAAAGVAAFSAIYEIGQHVRADPPDSLQNKPVLQTLIKYGAGYFSRPHSRRDFLRIGITTGLSATAVGRFAPDLATIYLEKKGEISGNLERASRDYFYNIVSRLIMEEYSDTYHIKHADEPLSISNRESITTSSQDSVDVLGVSRGSDGVMGNVYILLCNKSVPVITTANTVSARTISATQQFISRELRLSGVDARVFSAGWFTHHTLTYAQALQISSEKASGKSEEELRELVRGFYWNPPGGDRNQWLEAYAIHTPIASSRQSELSHLMISHGHYHLPENDVSGYSGSSSKHVSYIYTESGWDYDILDSASMKSRIKNPNGIEYSAWKPLLVLDSSTGTRFDALHETEEPQLVDPAAAFIVRDKFGRSSIGDISGDMTVKLKPSEIWNLLSSYALSKNFELMHVLFTDGGGSSGFAVPLPVSSRYGRVYSGTVTSFGRYPDSNTIAQSSTLAPKAVGTIIAELTDLFPTSHTIGQMHVCVDRKHILKVL